MDFFKQRVRIQSRAEDAADFVQKMQLLATPRSLLHEITIFDGHPNLMAESHQQMKLGGRKSAAIRRAEKKNAKRLVFCLQTDRRYGVQALLKSKLTEPMERFFALKSFPKRVTVQIAKNGETAETDDKFDKVIVETFLLGRGAECVAETDGNDSGRAFWIAVMKKQ